MIFVVSWNSIFSKLNIFYYIIIIFKFLAAVYEDKHRKIAPSVVFMGRKTGLGQQ